MPAPSTEGDYVHLRDVGLEQPSSVIPPLVLGVRRPLVLPASGRSADGSILAEPSAPAYIGWALSPKSTLANEFPFRTPCYSNSEIPH
jgi:hypothetical protein